MCIKKMGAGSWKILVWNLEYAFVPLNLKSSLNSVVKKYSINQFYFLVLIISETKIIFLKLNLKLKIIFLQGNINKK